MKRYQERLAKLQQRQQHCYEAYLSGEIDRQCYLVSVYTLDRAVDRLELSLMYRELTRLPKRKKRM